MLVNEMYLGSGLGNQIWGAVVVRILAEKLGYDYGIMGKHLWKGAGWMPFFWGNDVVGGAGPDGGPPNALPEGIEYWYKECQYRHPTTGHDYNPIDPLLFFLPDNTKVDGTFQNLIFIEDRRNDIREWCKVDEDKFVRNYSDDNICVVHFRGGDYSTGHSFLPPNYYKMAMNAMRKENPNVKFVVVTDDPNLARQHIPEAEVVGAAISDEPGGPDYKIGWYQMGGGPLSIDYTILNTAKYVIMSASTFSFWPVWLSTEVKKVIAPMYWFDWNVSDGFWRPADSIVMDWDYMDRNGTVKSAQQCWEEYENYKGVINFGLSGIITKYEND